MPASDVEQLMRTVTHAFAEGNLKPLLAAIHPDIVWKSGFGQAELFRYGGTHRERGGVLDVTSKIAMDYTFRRLQPKEIVANDDHVWGLFDAEIKYNPLGGKGAPKNIELEIAIRWRLKEGKIIEHQAFFDTALLLSQSGRSLELPGDGGKS